MKHQTSEEYVEALGLMRKKVDRELLCFKEKTKERLNLWSGLTTKFVMIKAFSDHLANTVELIEKQSLEAERSKRLLEGTISEQLIFLSKSTLQISDFSTNIDYTEDERPLCALNHGNLGEELRDLEQFLANAVNEAADIAKFKEMIEGELIAAKEASHRNEAMLLQVQESLLAKTEAADQEYFQQERLGSERILNTIEKLSFRAIELQAIRMRLQFQVQEHVIIAKYLEHCFVSRRDIPEDKFHALQAMLIATHRKAAESSLKIQTLNHMITILKEHNDENSKLVANMRQELADAKDALNKQSEESARQRAEEAVEVQKMSDTIRTLHEQNTEGAALVASLRQEVAEAKDAFNIQVEEAVQRKTEDAAEIQKLTDAMNILREQNDESSALVANMRQELANSKDALNKQSEESARQRAEEAVEVQKMSDTIRTLHEQNTEGAALVASLKREVTEAEDAFNKQILETTSLKKEYAVEVQNLNEQNRNLQEQNNESAVLIANLRQEVTESKDSLNQQFKKMVQREAEKAVEVKDLKDLIQSLTEKNAENSFLVANLRQEIAEAKGTHNKQVQEMAEQKARDAIEVKKLIEVIRVLRETNEEGAALVTNLKQELSKATDALKKQREEATEQKSRDTAEFQKMREVMRALKEQNDESSAKIANLRKGMEEANDALQKQVEEMVHSMAEKAVEVQNLNSMIMTLKEQNDENALLVAKLRQEAVEANETLLLHVEETAHQKATNAAEVQNLNHVIRIQEQSPEYGTLDVKLTQMVAETKENNSCHSDEEAGFCQSLIDHAHHIFKDFSEFKSWYSSGILEGCAPERSEENNVENNPLEDLIISFRRHELPNLKSLGGHLKYAKVASLSAYTKLIEDTLQEKVNLQNEMMNLQKKNEQLCRKADTDERSMTNITIQCETDLHAKADSLTRHLKDNSQCCEQSVLKLQGQYELKRPEIVTSETLQSHQETQSIKDTTDAKNVANTDMNQQIPMHAPVNPTEESALNFLQPTSKIQETSMKDSNEPQLKRLKTWEAVKSARGDVTDVVSTKKDGRRCPAISRDTNGSQQTTNRSWKDKKCEVLQQDLEPEGLSVPKRIRSTRTKSKHCSKTSNQQSRAQGSTSTGLRNSYHNSALSALDQEDDPYTFL
nr:paramyosin-like isoform X8 [Physcomitrium patens]|eukprot:XP_024363710.1 paramyosin-like isoform X8 [Physcomitrella patens]